MKKHLSRLKLVSLLIVMILLLIGNNKLEAQVAQGDKDILMDLYNATNGANWTSNTNWGTADVSTWYGVTVVSDVVVEIDLNHNNLDGSIPTSLGQLISLQYLNLDTNKILGSIPVELGNLSALQQLYLGGNQLNGTIPSSLGLLSNLKWLNLSDNQLSGTIPGELDQLDLLEYLQLGINNLTGSIPVGLADLASLKWLNLGGNQLDGTIPVALGQLSNLEQLYLNGNQLTGSIPAELGLLTKMKWLNLGQNQLSGSIPAELKTLTNLELLYLDGNQLTTIPADLGLLTGLQWLNLSGNQITGDIPAEIWNLTSLQLLYLNGNQLTGTIPDDLTSLTSLKWLFLNSNQLTSMPDLTKSATLIDLMVENNQLTFEHLEYNMDLLPVVNFYYSPQDSIGVNQEFTKNVGENFSYELITGGSQNNYQWYKDGNILASQTSATLTINNLALGDAGKYYCEVNNDIVSGLTLTSRKLSLSVKDPVGSLTVDFHTGWNIFSSTVMPDDKNLKNILQPLIDAGQLKKVMDESGKVIEDWGYFGGWQNTIGDLKSTEGYKINVIEPASLELTGVLTQLPFDIPLNAGWNIISWPSLNEQNGMDVFQTLIDESKLKKVMDESGKVIEDWGYFGGWQNSIGNFKPGEGYKVNVTSACTLTVNESGIKSVDVMPELKPSVHFIPVFKGNGIDHMNINLVNLAESGFKVGDEIGVFDENICVGSAQISNAQSLAFGALIDNRNSISIPVSAKDEATAVSDGFISGHEIILKLYREGKEYPLSLLPVNNTSIQFENNGTTFAKVNFGLNTGMGIGENEFNINCYPNPFDKFLNIEIKLSKHTDVTVEIYDLLSRKISQLYKGSAEQMLMLQWDGNDLQGNRAAPGIYICRVNDIWKKVVLNGK